MNTSGRRLLVAAASLAAIALQILLPCANACTTVMISPRASDVGEAVSFRTVDYDNGFDLNTSAHIVPKGSRLWHGLFAEDYACDDDLDALAYYKSKHDMVAIISHQLTHEQRAALAKEKANATLVAIEEAVLAGYMDGLNSAGLSCAALYDSTLTQVYRSAADAESISNSTSANETLSYYPESDTSSAALHLSVMNLCKYILANFASVQSVVEAITPSSVRLVQPRAAHRLGLDIMPMHIIVHDRTHDTWVMEFTNTDSAWRNSTTEGTSITDQFVWRNATKFGTVSNNDQYPDQLAALQTVIDADPMLQKVMHVADANAHASTLNASSELGLTQEMEDIILEYEEIQANAPGSYSSVDRFRRPALFNYLSGLVRLPPSAASYMPPPGLAYSGNQALLTALQLLGSAAVVPRGAVFEIYPGIPGEDLSYEHTQTKYLRDHAANALYFQAFGDMVWGKIDLARSVRGKQPIRESMDTAEGLLAVGTYAIPTNMGRLGHSFVSVDAEF